MHPLPAPSPCPPAQALTGHARVTDAGVEAIAGMGLLQQLELRLGGPATQW